MKETYIGVVEGSLQELLTVQSEILGIMPSRGGLSKIVRPLAYTILAATVLLYQRVKVSENIPYMTRDNTAGC
jgi:hypothetical protein